MAAEIDKELNPDGMTWIRHKNTQQVKQMKDHDAKMFLKSASWEKVIMTSKGPVLAQTKKAEPKTE